MTIHLQTSSSTSLRKSISEALASLRYRKQRRHHLNILSCYIDLPAIKKLIESVAEQVQLKEVSLCFEYMEAFRAMRSNETQSALISLKTWCANQDVCFSWNPVRAGALMHAKGYAVIQYTKETIADGIVCIGSNNATFRGIGITRSPNVELSYISGQLDDINDFLEIWRKLIEKTRSIDEASKKASDYDFSYMMLTSGIFLHDWNENLRSKIGITYPLTEAGKKAISLDVELQHLGFDIGAASISSNPLKSRIPFFRTLPKSFTRKYTIDTWIGRWCPISVWDVVQENVNRDERFEIFFKDFQSLTQPDALRRLFDQEKEKESRLVSRGFITESDDRIESWVEKIEILREDQGKLARIFMKFEDFPLPYDYSARDEVTDLHESISSSLAVKSTTSFVGKKVLLAEETRTLAPLRTLSKRERTSLEAILGAG